MLQDFTLRFDIDEYLEKHNLKWHQLKQWYLTAKDLCDQGKLVVTLEGKIPKHPEDLVGWVQEIYISRRKYIVIKISLYEFEYEGVITDANEVAESFDRGFWFEAKLVFAGKLIAIYKKRSEGWGIPHHIIRDRRLHKENEDDNK